MVFSLSSGYCVYSPQCRVSSVSGHAFGSSTNGDNPVPAFQEPPACPPPTTSVPAPTIASLGFLLHFMLVSSELLRFERSVEEGGPSAELSITSHTHGMTAHANVPVTGPAFGAIVSGSNDLTDPGIKPGICGFEPHRPNRSATRSAQWSYGITCLLFARDNKT